MGLSFSLLLTGLGAALLARADATIGVNIHMVAVIVLVVGLLGFVTSVFFRSRRGSFRGVGPGGSRILSRASSTLSRRPTRERAEAPAEREGSVLTRYGGSYPPW
jgi:hypothetical protein